MFKKILSLFLLFSSLIASFCFGQKNTSSKYPSLFWEITGNGLQKPSYLFGTMHVSSKLVFHLSDSFYLAIKNVDAVALELNPDLWQGQMVNLAKLKQNYADYIQVPGNDYLTENSFRIGKYDDELKQSLSTEPTVVNSLLYRNFKSKEDFEENTFLDLYIFQTGRKLGKRGTGVENYYETEKLVTEAYADMLKEKKKKNIDPDEETGNDMAQKMQDAYRRGDLDLMDSLDILMERSVAFREKFLYARNVIQANSIDTIIRKSSLFVGVGAAHLPGNRGVIELLRKMGYKLRPIMMKDRDAAQKEGIDKMKVPVSFSVQTADDSLYSVAMPGPLFKLDGEYQNLDRRQYSDMNNGVYYMVTRVKTHAAFLGQNENDVLNKLDSFLYENIPGKIITRKMITLNGYRGYDIVNRTRGGDLQRSRIIVTSFDVLIFKMSGKENYVAGKEAEQFFGSIKIREFITRPLVFQPKQGGFSVQLPHSPSVYNNTADDASARMEYEAVDKTTGTAYLVLKKSIYNFHFLDEDNFDLGLIEESFRNPDYFDKQVHRTPGLFYGYPCVDVTEKMKDGTTVTAKYIIKGPQYYVIAARSRDNPAGLNTFLSSFQFTGYNYALPATYIDSFLHFTVSSSVIPDLDGELRKLVEKTTEDIANAKIYSDYVSYWPQPKHGLFKSDATGEIVSVSVQEFPKYFYLKDLSKYWEDQTTIYKNGNDLVLYRSDTMFVGADIKGMRFILRDTNSSRTIIRVLMLKDNYSFSLVSMGDTLSMASSFINNFFSSFKPEEKKTGRNIYANRLDDFFSDLFSKDSVTRTTARHYIPNIKYGEEGIPKIMDAIANLKFTDKDYFETKTKLIAELGFIKDTTQTKVTALLQKIYEQTADTSYFQNEVIMALARHLTADSYKLLKELLLQDPPILENNYDYSGMFASLNDSLQLTHQLFPELLQLSAIDDYKENIMSLLVTLVDSGVIKAAEYENYFSKIYFDAKVELKKQLTKDEKIMENADLDDDERSNLADYNLLGGNAALNNYCVLLMPFYDKNIAVQKYYDKLLRSKDPSVRLDVSVFLLRHYKAVADSILQNLAATDRFRSRLYIALKNIKQLNQFPGKYNNQQDMARSLLLLDKDFAKVDSIVFISKQPTAYPGKKGTVYFFKYRVKNEDDWKIGISGLQPENEKETGSDDRLCIMTDKKIKNDQPLEEQFQKQLKRALLAFHKSAKIFYGNDDYYGRMKVITDYEE
jgi:uncharacterized protein YbaP (TraB family)